MNHSKYKYPLLALDMDGTVLNSERIITPRTKKMLDQAIEEGVEVVLSTGRCTSELTKYLDMFSNLSYFILESGACVYDKKNDKVVYSAPLSVEQMDFILDLIAESEVMVQLFIDNQSYISIPDDSHLAFYHMEECKDIYEETAIYKGDLIEEYRANPHDIEKINMYFHDPAERTRIWDILVEKGFAVASSIATIVEVSNPNANKGKGLEALCKYLEIEPSQVIAVGDSDNDIDLLKVAGVSVAMDNAIPQIKELADEITAHCDHDGVADVIEKYYF